MAGTPCIVFESVYSMDGDVRPYSRDLRSSRTYGAMTYIDEVHAVGLYGEHRSRLSRETKPGEHRVDIVNGTLGKAFGVQGGYIAADADVIDAVRSVASGFIFTTSMSPVTVLPVRLLLSKYSAKTIINSERQHQERARKLKERMIKAGLQPMECSTTHIVPLFIGDAVKCKADKRYAYK